MCTVAFFAEAPGGYLLGHNRDESRSRSRGLAPTRLIRGDRAVLAPRDPDGGGAWIGVNDAGVTLCLLNAPEADPSRLPPDPESRGVVLWEALHLDSIEAAVDHLARARAALDDVRAFHLAVAEPQASGRLPRVGRFRWDGLHAQWDLHEGPSLFVSSSRDQADAERERGACWARLLGETGRADRDALARWLASHEPKRGPLSVCMHRPEAHTVSRTLVRVSGTMAEMAYVDGPPCEGGRENVQRLPLRLG